MKMEYLPCVLRCPRFEAEAEVQIKQGDAATDFLSSRFAAVIDR
jgi:hypothetical protein